ncbi:MFS transporter [Penicillium cosmopolitanum]|uniref:MFS transporter n=1 Tax=Penicillium cosmopolitanum TaxID=1131564 RepID=A0A9X0BCC3_9EURO|nr:MFS transporter [Penicillium cosmopolitanum]KAJ5404620.1 MFS transporter [Penicillium cosmopolitanum]
MASRKSSLDIEMIETNPNHSPTLTDDELLVEKRLVRKIDLRLLPLASLVYLLCYLDRSNIGNARIFNSNTGDDLMQTLDLTSHQYIIALMVFLVAYSIFETPSNLALKTFSPKRWLGFLIFCYGAFCTGIGVVHNFASISALRFFLGAAEAGVFPGMVYYLSFWYKPEERALRIAAFLCSATLSGAFGGCIAYGVGFMNGVGGLQAWRWLFILEGIPSVILGILVFLFLPSYPEQCGWLTTDEKAIQRKRMGDTGSSNQRITWVDAKATLLDLRLYVHYLSYIGVGCLIGSLSLFAPTIVLGLGFEGLRAQLFTVPPYAAAFFSTVAAAFISDRLKMRGVIVGSSLAVCFISFLILAALPGEHFVGRYILLIIGTCGAFSGLPTMNAWIGDNITNTTAMSLATAINIAFSGPGQIIGVWIYRPADSPIYSLGHGVNAAFAAFSAILCFSLSFYYRRLNVKDGRGWFE